MEIRDTSRVVLFDIDNNVLLQKVMPLEPLKYDFDDVWIFPGGKIEDGESLQECAERELYEETGIDGCDFGPALWYGEIVLELRGVKTLFKTHFVYARLNKLCAPNEGDDFGILENKWWNIEDLISQKIPVFPITLPKMLKNISKASQLPKQIKEISYSFPLKH